MVKLDHLAIRVRDVATARDWYTRYLGLTVEFEIPDQPSVALQDDAGFTLFLAGTDGDVASAGCVLTFQVDDVDAKHRELLATGVAFAKPPGRQLWGYGAELTDPDGHLIYLWDKTSMREKGQG
jgi:catechol 2,3-dioxygenase-like lactoylglutathione lyase family enzyme